MEDRLSDMAGGSWSHLQEMRHKYCQFQDLCLRNRAGLNGLLVHDSRKPITNNPSSIHHVVLCVRRPTWELGGGCSSYELRSSASYCFCQSLEKQHLGTEDNFEFLEMF